MIFTLFLFVNSCKKENQGGEKIDPARKKEMLAYKDGPTIEIINLAQFKNKANLNALGTLKQEFVSASPSKSNLMSIQTAETYLGFNIITDSIKVIKDKGHTMYVFPVALSSKRAASFQNLTIDESTTGTVAFVNTYTPTKKWTADWRKGHPGKFDGEISVTYLKLNNGSKSPTQKTIAVAQICTTTTYYFEIPYLCASGNHYPGETCYLSGDERAGYTLYEFTLTECVDDPNPPIGGGGTSPTPPPTYNPYPGAPPAVSGKKSFGNKIMVAPPTPCDEVVDCAGVSGGTAYINTNCNTCMGGTTGISECAIDLENPKDKYELQVVQDSIDLKKRLDCFKNISSQGATYYIRLCTDIPNNSSPNDLLNGAYVGHSFITMTKTNGSNQTSQTFGFYPRSQTKALIGNDVPSMIGDNEAAEYNASYGINVTASQFNGMLTQAPELAKNRYDLKNYNCTNYAIDLFNAGSPTSISVPDWKIERMPYTFNYGATPNGLYKKINEMKNSGDNNASINTANGPESTKCN